jgi:hypothetical protein
MHCVGKVQIFLILNLAVYAVDGLCDLVLRVPGC